MSTAQSTSFQSLEEALQHWFGYSEFRSPQKEIIQSLLDGESVLALLPTGTGKSLCYQLPGLLLPHITLVVSPLIALIDDQVSFLQSKGVKALALTGKMTRAEIEKSYQEIIDGVYTFVFAAPERLKSARFQHVLQSSNISLVAIDEAHCISQWGHDFRPEYAQVGTFLANSSITAPCIALTATATQEVCRDISTCLNFSNHKLYKTSFIRSNLTLRSFYCKSKNVKLMRLVQICLLYLDEVGIIYVSTRKEAEYVSNVLNNFSWLLKKRVAFYHAGMSQEERSVTQRNFLDNSCQIMVATTAFGMGINKSNVRYIVHFSSPASVEQYYQEIGRAGRDGVLSDTFLLWHEFDFDIHKELQKKTSNTRLLEEMKKFVITKVCKNHSISSYFDETTPNTCCLCDNCTNLSLTDTSSAEFLFTQLASYCSVISQEYKIRANAFLTESMIWWVIITRPVTEQNYITLPGFGQGWIETWRKVLPRLHDILHSYEHDDSTTYS